MADQPNWAEIYSMWATVATAVIAGYALLSWKYQRKYELRMEGLSKSRLAMNLVKKLRYAPLFDKSDNDIITDYMDMYEVILKNERLLFEDILRIKEMLWATFGERNNNTFFYSEVVRIIEDIRNSRMDLWLSNFHNDVTDPQVLEVLDNSAWYHGDNDPVLENLEKLHKAMIRR